MSVIAIAAVGFTMQFGITNMINLAYGEVMISSAYLAYYLNRAGLSIWIGMVAGALFGAVFSFLLNRVVYAPFMRKGTANLGMVIVSLAVSLMISNLLLPIVGYYSVSYQEDAGSLIRLGSIALTRDQIIVFGIANGSAFLITILAAAVLGGAGQPYGAMIGAVMIGLITELSAAAWSPQYKEVVAFGILVLVMVLRPQGLLAKRGALAAAG